jgi:predicted enzyme related to lactoylglutathione lyase
MQVRGVNWTGVKTDRYEEMASFFRTVVGLTLALEQADFTVFELPDGGKLETFGPEGPAPAEQFAENQVVAGFFVDDIAEATAELRRAGVELLGDLHIGSGGYAWQHFRAPDGEVFELCPDPTQ